MSTTNNVVVDGKNQNQPVTLEQGDTVIWNPEMGTEKHKSFLLDRFGEGPFVILAVVEAETANVDHQLCYIGGGIAFGPRWFRKT